MNTTTISDGTRSMEVSELCLGTMYFGTTVDENTSQAILDRFVHAGGNFLDTANAYSFWVEGGVGGESEEVLGRWLRSRNAHGRVVVATKVGAHIKDASGPHDAHGREGLSPPTIRGQAAASLRRLGTDRIDLYYAHADDRETPLEETVGALGELVSRGEVGLVAASNHTAWRLALARDIARRSGVAPYAAIQQRHSYLEARHMRGRLTDAIQLPITPELLDYVRDQGNLTILGYSALLSGAYTRPDRRLPPDYDTPMAPPRLAVARDVANELGATVNQVVLAWMLAGDPPILPILGVSSVEQLEECLGAAQLRIPEDAMQRLDAA